MILLADQPLLPFHHEQMVKAFACFGEFGPFKAEHRRELSLALHPLLISGGKSYQADASDHNKANLESQSDHAAEQFLPLS